MADNAQVYLYQERVGENPSHRTQKVVGTELVLEDRVVLTTELDLRDCGLMKSNALVTEMGRFVARQLSNRAIQDYDVHLYERFSGDCIAEEDFHYGNDNEIPEGKIYQGDDVVAHMQHGFLKGLCLDDGEAYNVLWGKTHPRKKKE